MYIEELIINEVWYYSIYFESKVDSMYKNFNMKICFYVIYLKVKIIFFC